MDTHFNNWVKFLSACELDDDIFLDEYSCHDRITLLGAYAHSVREKAYSESSKGYARLVASSSHAAITGVCTTFVSTGRPSPSLDEAGKTSFLLHQQFRGYSNNDPSPKPQKTIPLK